MRFVDKNGISRDYKINRDGPTLLLLADMEGHACSGTVSEKFNCIVSEFLER
jgi:hypothetical protein